MTLILNGTDNSATTPAVQGGTAGTTTGVYYPATNQVAIATNGTQAMLVNATQNVTFAQAANLPNTFGFKNRIINGAMVIDQRNAGASVSGTTAVYTVDRWTAQNNSGAARFNVQQNVNSVTPPAGYKYYLGVTSTSAYTVASTDVIGVQQFIEGYNIADLAWGTASAASVTLSFWVRSSLTGTFGGCLAEANAATAFYAFTYTISTANTWEQKTVTIAGPTIGTWNSTNARGIQVLFNLGTGSTYIGAAGAWTASSYYAATGATNFVATNAATFYITGVQLEKGSTATSFDYRPHGTELAMCQRYYITGGNVYLEGYQTASNGTGANNSFPIAMRAAPSVSYSGNSSTLMTGSPAASSITTLTFVTRWVKDGTSSPFNWLSTYTASSEL